MRTNGQGGFTLVELSIVLVIVGLLIGGVLKAQQLIEDARLNRTLTQVEAFRSAAATFADRYGALPGDIADAGSRIPNVAAAASGNGDGVINGAGNSGEGLLFWHHLARAGLILGDYDGATAQLGVGLPAASIGGGFNVLSVGVQGLVGNWIQLGAPNASGATIGGLLTPDMARRLDARIDDGRPQTGLVRTPVAACIDDAGRYDVSETGQICTLAFKL